MVMVKHSITCLMNWGINMVDIVTVKEANLSMRARNILDRMRIKCLNELQYMTVKELLEVVGMGKGAVKELQGRKTKLTRRSLFRVAHLGGWGDCPTAHGIKQEHLEAAGLWGQ